jgi:hypothetical protein
MKRIALFALAAAVAVVLAASPAEAAKKKKARVAAAPVVTNVNEASARLFRDGLVIFLPSWSMPLYIAASGRTW